MRRKTTSGRFAERVLNGFDDAGGEERIVLWIERKPGALWAVGRAVNPQHRRSEEPRADDYLFEGYELVDALEVANSALEDDVRVLETVGLVVDVVDAHAQRLRQVQLQQPVVADDLDRDAFAGGRQRDAAAALVLEQLERGELLHHRAHG